jgi:short subunit dehydrogenase-like uncharacterized protein
MSEKRSWILYGAGGHTGALIAKNARERGHQPVLAGRSPTAVSALAQSLDLECRVLSLDDPAGLHGALADVELLLNAAGPFLHTASPLAEACLNAGVHYLDISNELQVFRALYDLDERAQRTGIAIIPGVGFGVVATNGLARHASEAVGGAQTIEVGSRIASAQPGPGAAATMRENLPYGGWVRQEGELRPKSLGSGTTSIVFPDGTFGAMPVPTGDLEAAFRATGAPNVVAYSVAVDPLSSPRAWNGDQVEHDKLRSFGWARATGPDGRTAEMWLQTGDSYRFTADASVRAVEEALSGLQIGALSPAGAFGADFAFTIQDTTRICDLETLDSLVPTGEAN